MGTKIEWTEDVFNPIVGCSKISEGCRNCYAESMAQRLYDIGVSRELDSFFKACSSVESGSEFVTWGKAGDGIEAYQHVIDCDTDGKLHGWSGKTAFVESALDKPVKRKKPTTYFVCSMGDLFHETVPAMSLDRVFDVMATENQHTYILLTKRPARMAEYVNQYRHRDSSMAHVIAGVTVESQKYTERLNELSRVNLPKRLVSLEPLLGPVDITPWLSVLDQVIVGGESGPNARPMYPEWVRTLSSQCAATATPFFFKQWGAWYPLQGHGIPTRDDEECTPYIWVHPDGTRSESGGLPARVMIRVGKKCAGRMLDGRTHDELIWRG